MNELNALLESVAEGLQSLSKSVEAIGQQLESLSKDRQRKPAVKTRKPVRKTAKPAKTAANKQKRVTAADTVYAIIKRSRKSVNIEMLKKRTGFNEKNIHNIVYKLKKQGLIQSISKGVYLKT
jgi:predicted Rossmann fold nucleotide-binding protein DprA/Smf involved in DNA uptake